MNEFELRARNKKAQAMVKVLTDLRATPEQALMMDKGTRKVIAKAAEVNPPSNETWKAVVDLMQAAPSVERIARKAGKVRMPAKKSTVKTKTKNALIKAVKQNQQSLEFFINFKVPTTGRQFAIHREGLDEILIALKQYNEVR